MRWPGVAFGPGQTARRRRSLRPARRRRRPPGNQLLHLNLTLMSCPDPILDHPAMGVRDRYLQPNIPPRPALSTSLTSPQWVYRTDTNGEHAIAAGQLGKFRGLDAVGPNQVILHREAVGQAGDLARRPDRGNRLPDRADVPQRPREALTVQRPSCPEILRMPATNAGSGLVSGYAVIEAQPSEMTT